MSSAPRTTTWPIGEHTKGKHLVLRKYLYAWLPILGTTQGRVVFIDGFAGPGEYTGGEEGSPVIALKALSEHSARARISAQVVFWFIEADESRYEFLKKRIEPLVADLKGTADVMVSHGEFDRELSELLGSDVSGGQLELAPAFVMVDPFGVSQTPMRVIRQIIKQPKSEVYISFMAESIHRFKGEPGFESHLDDLFGTEEWRQSLTIQNGRDARRFMFDLYKKQLKDAGADHVVHFELYREHELVYAIFFATHSLLGCDKMKEAIWKADPAGGTCFIAGRDAALDLFDRDVSRFEPELVSFLARYSEEMWVPIGELKEFAQSDKTHFYSGQMKGALKNLELAGTIEVKPGTRKIRNTYPDGTFLRLVRTVSSGDGA